MLCSENSFSTQLVHEPPKILEKTRLLVYRVFLEKERSDVWKLNQCVNQVVMRYNAIPLLMKWKLRDGY